MCQFFISPPFESEIGFRVDTRFACLAYERFYLFVYFGFGVVRFFYFFVNNPNSKNESTFDAFSGVFMQKALINNKKAGFVGGTGV